MKIRIITAILLVSTLFIGCKKDKSIDSLEVVKAQVKDNTFKVTLSVIVKKDDNFSLFYSEDGTIEFKAPTLWQSIKGMNSEQNVIFVLPDDVFPTELRLDFGLNKNQEDIIFKSVTLEYKGKSRVISGKELGFFFRADTTKCSFDPESGLIKANIIDGVRQYPSLYPHEIPLGKEIDKLDN